MKTTLTAAALLAAISLAATSTQAADCGTAGTVTIADMTWLPAGTLAHVAQKIMASGYGCDAQLTAGDTVPTATLMLIKDQPDVAFWGPTDVIGTYHMVRMATPPFDAENDKCLVDMNCADPKVSGWANGEVAVVVSRQTHAPDVAEFLSKMQVPNDEVSAVLASGDDNGATTDEVATYFLKSDEPIWTQGVLADVTDKVRASL